MKKGLVNGLLIAGLATGLTGCGPSYPQYKFHDRVNGENVNFRQAYGFFNKNTELTVIGTNGIKSIYFDTNNDLKVDFIWVYETAEGDKTYSDYSVYPDATSKVLENPLLPKIQEKFDSYLEKIILMKTIESEEKLNSAGISLE